MKLVCWLLLGGATLTASKAAAAGQTWRKGLLHEWPQYGLQCTCGQKWCLSARWQSEQEQEAAGEQTEAVAQAAAG